MFSVNRLVLSDKRARSSAYFSVFSDDCILALPRTVCALHSTYIAANTTLTACERHQVDPTYWKLAITSAVNMGAGITKDSLFARWFGQQAAPSAAASGASSASATSSTIAATAIKSAPAPTPAPAASIPLATWGLFVCRDVFTIGAGFVLPDMVSRAALAHRLVESKALSDTVAQLTVRALSAVMPDFLGLRVCVFFFVLQQTLNGAALLHVLRQCIVVFIASLSCF
jgi:hypothetical protein